MVATSHQCCNKSPTLLDLVSVSAKSAHNNEQALSIVVHGNVQWKDLFPYVLNGRAPCSDLRPNFASAARGFAQGIFCQRDSSDEGILFDSQLSLNKQTSLLSQHLPSTVAGLFVLDCLRWRLFF